jgi:hypothetical protein
MRSLNRKVALASIALIAVAVVAVWRRHEIAEDESAAIAEGRKVPPPPRKFYTFFGIPLWSQKIPGATAKLGFDSPLAVGETVAVRDRTNIWFVTLMSVDAIGPDAATFKIRSPKTEETIRPRENEFLELPGIRFRWSSAETNSIWIYGGYIMGASGYDVAYPVSLDQQRDLLNDQGTLEWKTKP